MVPIFRDCTLCLCEVVAEQLPEEDKVAFFHDHQHYDYHDQKFWENKQTITIPQQYFLALTLPILPRPSSLHNYIYDNYELWLFNWQL